MNIEDLFLENMDQLYRTALFMLSNSLDAEDVVQETYVRLLIKKPYCNDKEHGKAWLLRVCINLCKNQLRFKKRHPQDELWEQTQITYSLEDKEVLYEISSLPTKLKSVIVLYAINGYSIKEISKILKISEYATKKRLQRAREKLSLQLEVNK